MRTYIYILGANSMKRSSHVLVPVLLFSWFTWVISLSSAHAGTTLDIQATLLFCTCIFFSLCPLFSAFLSVLLAMLGYTWWWVSPSKTSTDIRLSKLSSWIFTNTNSKKYNIHTPLHFFYIYTYLYTPTLLEITALWENAKQKSDKKKNQYKKTIEKRVAKRK